MQRRQEATVTTRKSEQARGLAASAPAFSTAKRLKSAAVRCRCCSGRLLEALQAHDGACGRGAGRELDGLRLVFLPRHGRGHPLPPTAVNARANIDALKQCGCTDVISLSAVGSLREGLSPGTFVIVDQFIDRTFAREKSFFGAGFAAHVSMAEPVCPRLSGLAAEAARRAGARSWSRRAGSGTCRPRA